MVTQNGQCDNYEFTAKEIKFGEDEESEIEEVELSEMFDFEV